MNSIQLQTGPAIGNPSGLAVSVYTHSSVDSRFPGTWLGSLTGPDPTAGGIFSYHSSDILLSPRTGYFLVLSATTPTADGAFAWSLTKSFGYDSSDGWGRAIFRYSSADGLSWDRNLAESVQFGVNATAVPEPSSWLLVALGLAGWRFRMAAFCACSRSFAALRS